MSRISLEGLTLGEWASIATIVGLPIAIVGAILAYLALPQPPAPAPPAARQAEESASGGDGPRAPQDAASTTAEVQTPLPGASSATETPPISAAKVKAEPAATVLATAASKPATEKPTRAEEILRANGSPARPLDLQGEPVYVLFAGPFKDSQEYGLVELVLGQPIGDISGSEGAHYFHFESYSREYVEGIATKARELKPKAIAFQVARLCWPTESQPLRGLVHAIGWETSDWPKCP